MRTRHGFVSNSSSTNFVLLAQGEISPCNLTVDDLKNEDVFGIGFELSNGTDYFIIKDEKMLQFVKDYSRFFEVYKDCIYFSEHIGGTLDVSTLKYPTYKVRCIHGDQWGSGSIDGLISNYHFYLEDEITKEQLEEKYL